MYENDTRTELKIRGTGLTERWIHTLILMFEVCCVYTTAEAVMVSNL